MQDEPVEDSAERSLGRGNPVSLGHLPGHGCPECGDALHELAGGISHVHGLLESLALGREVSDGSRGCLSLARGHRGHSTPLAHRHALLPKKPIETLELPLRLGLDAAGPGQLRLDLGQSPVTLVGQLVDGARVRILSDTSP